MSERETVRYNMATDRDWKEPALIRRADDYDMAPSSIRQRMLELVKAWKHTAGKKHHFSNCDDAHSETAHKMDQRVRDVLALLEMAGLS